jgi:hypothetical protein
MLVSRRQERPSGMVGDEAEIFMGVSGGNLFLVYINA